MAKALGKFHTQTPLSKDVTLFKKGTDLFLSPDLKKTVSIKKIMSVDYNLTHKLHLNYSAAF